jgi:CHAD domain-containing protein
MRESPRHDLFQERIDSFVHELPGLADDNLEARHRARVASRRLRELLPVLGMAPHASRKLGRRLRRVTRRLGTVRELDVLLLLIEEFQCTGRYSPAALKQVGTAVGRARDAACKRLITKLPIAKLERLANRLERAVELFRSDAVTVGRPGANGEPRAWLWALDARLARRATSVRSAIYSAGGLYSGGRLHDVRIAVKKLRYASELSTEVGRRRIASEIAALERAQDLLGRLHDLEVLVAWARDVQAKLSLPDLMAWRQLRVLIHEVEADCRRLHTRYLRHRLSLIAIADRLGPSRPHSASRVALPPTARPESDRTVKIR